MIFYKLLRIIERTRELVTHNYKGVLRALKLFLEGKKLENWGQSAKKELKKTLKVRGQNWNFEFLRKKKKTLQFTIHAL